MLEKDHFCDAIDRSSFCEILKSLPHAAAVLNAQGRIIEENHDFRCLRDRAAPVQGGFDFFKSLNPVDLAKIQHLSSSQESHYQFTWYVPGSSPSAHLAEVTKLTCGKVFSGLFCQIIFDQSGQGPTLHRLMDNLDQGVWDYNLETGIFTASRAWRKLRGWSAGREVGMTDEGWLKRIHPEDRQSLKDAIRDQRKGKKRSIVVQYRHRHEDGHWVWILCRSSVVEFDPSGRPIRIVGTDTDISETMDSQKSLNRLAGKLKLAVEASGMGIWEYNPATKQVHWDDRVLEIYGITDGQNIRSDNLWESRLHPDDYEETLAYEKACRRRNEDFKRDFRIVQPSGNVRHVRSLSRTLEVPNALPKLIGVNIDVTDDYQRAQELEIARAKLEHDALHDELTSLGNRRGLDRCAAALFNRVTAKCRYAAMHIDLDHFKSVNDTLGHSAGDYVLSRVGAMLAGLVGKRGRAFRVGGDEFAVLIEDAPDKKTLDKLCETLIGAISDPMEYEGQPCSIGASIGYAVSQGPPKSQSSIFVEADTALYAAKRAGRQCYRRYTDKIGAEFHLISNAGQDLTKALDSEQIVCFFQPQYHANTLELVGAEALVRWQCPKRGLLSPAEFLPKADDDGLLAAIDYCVFQRVVALQSEWVAQGLSLPRVSVNISRARLEDEALLDQTRAALKDHHRIAFELLETTFYDSPSSAVMFTLDSLRELGVRIEMDDFGTGHSSVKALQVLRPNAVKIDRSLVATLGTQAKQLDVLKSLSRIARLEGADVVVEGLETGTHLAAIRMLDCDILQGYVLQRPMAEVEFAALLANGIRSASSKTAS